MSSSSKRCGSWYIPDCPPCTLWCNYNENGHTIRQFSQKGSPKTKVFSDKDVAEIRRVPSKTVFYRYPELRPEGI